MEQANIKPTISVVGADRTAPTLPMGAVPAPGLPQIVPSIDDQISRPVQVIAHRGGATEAPENTMGAFVRALELGVDGVEFDLQRTRDDRLIVLHDDTLERTAAPFSEAVQAETGLDAEGYQRLIQTNVNFLTLAEVQRVDIGTFFGSQWKSERVPVFEDTLELIARYPGRKLYAEIKRGDTQSADLCKDVVERMKPSPEQLWFIGFTFDVVKYTKHLLPSYPAMHVLDPRVPVLGMTSDEYVELALRSARELDGVDPCAVPTSVSPRLINAVHSLPTALGAPRKIVACWVWKKFPETDELENWRKLIDANVDAITTDKPAEMVQFLENEYPPDGGFKTEVDLGAKRNPLSKQSVAAPLVDAPPQGASLSMAAALGNLQLTPVC